MDASGEKVAACRAQESDNIGELLFFQDGGRNL